VPPPAATVASPSATPLHDGSLLTEMLAVNSGGSVKVMVAVVVHPLASLTVTVYSTPAESPVPVAPDPPVGDHA